MNARRGIVAILAATVVAGAAGYVVQILVPLWITDPNDYLQFGIFWSTTFLFVSMISGMQQEVARAVVSREPSQRSQFGSQHDLAVPTLRRAGAVLFVGIVLLGALLATFGGNRLFFIDTWSLAGAFVVALGGYLAVAILSGVFYGVEAYGFAASTTAIDGVLRFVTVLIPTMFGLGLATVAYGIAVPFILTALVMLGISAPKLKSTFVLDVNTPKLLTNGTLAMLAALATGLLISGLPVLLSFTALRFQVESLASVILALTLTRAPLVVPILALQSYLVVSYRKLQSKSRQRATTIFGGVILLTVVFAALAWLVGPWGLNLVYGVSFSLAGPEIALVVASGGATAGLAAIAPALLARSLHTHYVISWVIAVASTVIALIFWAGSIAGALVAVTLGPIAGCLYVFYALSRSHQDEPPAHPEDSN